MRQLLVFTILASSCHALTNTTCNTIRGHYQEAGCCSNNDITVTVPWVEDELVHTIRVSTQVESGRWYSGLYSPPLDPSANVPLLVFLQGGTEGWRIKNFGFQDRAGVLQEGDYGILEINHYDNDTDSSYWAFSNPVSNSVANQTRTMNEDVSAIVSMIKNVQRMQIFSSLTLIGHSMGTHIASAVLFPSMLSPDVVRGLNTSVDWGSETIRSIVPEVSQLANLVDRVVLLTPYDLSPLGINSGLSTVFGDRVGAPSKPFVIFSCAFDHMLPWTGIGSNLAKFILGEGGDPSQLLFQVSAQAMIELISANASSVTTVTHDYLEPALFNANLVSFKDTPDNAETEDTRLEFSSGVTGRIFLMGRTNFESGGFQTCAHGAPGLLPNGLLRELKREILTGV